MVNLLGGAVVISGDEVQGKNVPFKSKKDLTAVRHCDCANLRGRRLVGRLRNSLKDNRIV